MLNNKEAQKTADTSLDNLSKTNISDDFYKSLIENVKDVLARYNLDLRFEYISPNIKEYTGEDAEFYIGKTHSEANFFPDLAQTFDEHLKKAMTTKQLLDVNFSIMGINGLIYANTRVYPEYDVDGNVKSIIIVTRNDTQRKKVEKSLIHSEEKYRALFDSSPNYTLVIGIDGIIRDINSSALEMFGASKEELIGKHFMEVELFPHDELLFHYEKISILLNHGDLAPYEAKIMDKNGNSCWIEVALSFVKRDKDIDNILVICKDITQRKIAENEIKKSLNEKELLLNEIHHRVKNNMQIISSLLNLQTQFVNGDNESALDVLKECQNRVMSMARIHEKLYQSKVFTFIKFDDYLEKLVLDLFYSYKIPKGQIKPLIESEDIQLNMETAIPCSLIINELLSNSLKHAFPQGKQGEVYVSLKTKLDEYELIISDNGKGLDENFNYKKSDSLGLNLVCNLVDQLGGTISLEKTHGTTYKIIFKELKYKKRI